MIRLMTRIFILVLFTTFGTAYAEQQGQTQVVDTAGLKPEQVKALSELASQLRREPENTLANLTLQNTTPDRFKEWADAGAAAGKAVSSFTKEIGIAADQFLQTDAGRIGLYALLWKFGGDKMIANLINLVSGLVLATILYTFWWKLTRRFVMGERRLVSIEYNQNTFLRWLGFNKRTVTNEIDERWMEGLNSDDRSWVVFLSRLGSVVMLFFITWFCWPRVSF